MHFFKDSSGEDVEPLEDEHGDEHGDEHDEHGDEHEEHEDENQSSSGNSRRGKAWRNSMLASFCVLLCTVIGALIRLPFLHKFDPTKHSKTLCHSF